MNVHKRCWARQGVIEQKLVVAIVRAEAAEKQAESNGTLLAGAVERAERELTRAKAAEKQLAEAQVERDGLYRLLDAERTNVNAACDELATAQARIVHLERLADEALTVAKMCNDATKEQDES